MQIDTDASSSDSIGEELERSIFKALEHYSNVHRGSGHHAVVTTMLYEKARKLVLKHLGLSAGKYHLIFCSHRRALLLASRLKKGQFKILSSREIGLAVGVSAIALKKGAMPRGAPPEAGGGNATIISPEWEVWASGPGRYESGTPQIVNVIAFAKALQLLGKYQLGKYPAKTPSLNQGLCLEEFAKLSGSHLLENLMNEWIGNDIYVPFAGMKDRYIHLDSSASTLTLNPVWEKFWDNIFSEEIEKCGDDVKAICREFLNAKESSYDILFTSNTTESVNLVAKNLEMAAEKGTETVIINSLLEHSSNDLPWRLVRNARMVRIPFDNSGFVSLPELERILVEYNVEKKHGGQRVKMVALTAASNILGTCNNIHEITRIAHEYGAEVLIDAAQLVAHRKLDMEAIGADYLAFSGHKIYAPFGTGVLVARKGQLNYSEEELAGIKVSGEDNVAGVAALGCALSLLMKIGMEMVHEREKELTSQLLEKLNMIPGIKIFGISDPHSPELDSRIGVVSFNLEKEIAMNVARKLAVEGGIGTRYGCHCAHIGVKTILNVGPGLERFQRILGTLFRNINFPGVMRVSIGLNNTTEDIERFTECVKKINSKDKKSKNHEGSVKQVREYARKVAGEIL